MTPSWTAGRKSSRFSWRRRTARAPRTFCGDELLDAGFADADEGELGSHEEAVGEDEQGHRDGAKEEQAGHWLGASWKVESERCGEEREKPGFRHMTMIIDGRLGLMANVRIENSRSRVVGEGTPAAGCAYPKT